MAKKKYNNISDIPESELRSMMISFGQKKAKSVKSARSFLRSIGFEISTKGELRTAVSIPMVIQ